MDRSMISRDMTINDIADIHHKWVKDVETFEDSKSAHTHILLIISKMGEVINECLKHDTDKLLGRKLAGVVLRIFDLARQEKIDIDYEIVSRIINNHAYVNIKNRSK